MRSLSRAFAAVVPSTLMVAAMPSYRTVNLPSLLLVAMSVVACTTRQGTDTATHGSASDAEADGVEVMNSDEFTPEPEPIDGRMVTRSV